MQAIDEVKKQVQALGFNPPAASFWKPDARGPEYGKWEVLVVGESHIEVKYHSADEAGYNFKRVFNTLKDFANWSKL